MAVLTGYASLTPVIASAHMEPYAWARPEAATFASVEPGACPSTSESLTSLTHTRAVPKPHGSDSSQDSPMTFAQTRFTLIASAILFAPPTLAQTPANPDDHSGHEQHEPQRQPADPHAGHDMPDRETTDHAAMDHEMTGAFGAYPLAEKVQGRVGFRKPPNTEASMR